METVRRLEAEADVFERFTEALDETVGLWDEAPERGAAAVRGIRAPTDALLQSEWSAMMARIDATRAACGW